MRSQEMKVRKGLLGVLCLLAFLLLAVLQPEPAAGWSRGRKGSATNYYCGGVWRFLRFSTPPGTYCHVEEIDDGSPWLGWGAAQQWDSVNREWIEIDVCSYVDGYSVRINTHSSITVRDPIVSTSVEAGAGTSGPVRSSPWLRGPVSRSGPPGADRGSGDLPATRGGQPWTGPDDLRQLDNACSAEIDPGIQARHSEPPEEPVEPADFRTACAEVCAESPVLLPTEFVLDCEEETGITRVTNPPWGQGMVVARALAGPDTTSLYPVPPGTSLRVLPDGSLEPGTVLVEPAAPIHAAWGEFVDVSFAIHNLGPAPADYELAVEDSHGWSQWAGPPVVSVPPGGFEEVLVPVAVPPETDPWMDGVRLRATDLAQPEQFHWGMTYVMAGRGGVSGVVGYGGPETGRIQVGAYSDWSMPYFDPDVPELLSEPGEFDLDALAPGTYLIAGYLDADGDGRPTPGDPVGFHDPDGDGIADWVTVGAGDFLPGIGLELNDFYTPLDWADHDVGNCILTVTDQGSIGFLDATQAIGSGFIYPRDGENNLFIGSPWIGLDPAYIANRDYLADPAQELVVSTSPDGHVWLDHSGRSDQDLHAGFTDEGAASPRGLHVDQVSLAYADPEGADDFVIVSYAVENQSPAPMDEVFVGLFLDLDVAPDPYSNEGAVDPEHQLVYLTEPLGVHAGVALLQLADGSIPVANLTLIHNPTFVWPSEYVLDPDKWAFLTAADPEHVLTESFQPDDYGVLASAGPFVLGPGETQEVAFAVVGGANLAELRDHAAAAQLIYTGSVTGVEDRAAQGGLARLLPVSPNPFSSATSIRFVLPEPQTVRLDILDAGGRRLRELASGIWAAGDHVLHWDGRDGAGRSVAEGVYFVRLQCAERSQSRRAVLVR